MTRRKGPKNYQRSDERLREQIVDRLMDESDVNLEDVEVEVKQGTVTLSGTVESRRCKHEIEDTVDSIWGVNDITNNLRVKREDTSSMGSTGGSAGDYSSGAESKSQGGSYTTSTSKDTGSYASSGKSR